MAKEITAYLETSVNVILPDGVEPDSEEAASAIRGAFLELLLSQDEVQYHIETEAGEE